MDSPPDPFRFVKSTEVVNVRVLGLRETLTSALNHKVPDRPMDDTIFVVQRTVRQWRQPLLAGA